MALRAKQPEIIEKRLKVLFYGLAGAGKTTTAIQFPKPYLIDTEKGSVNDDYVKTLKEVGGVIFQTTEFDELITEVKSLLTEKHEYKTLIIDPLTMVYNDLLDKCARDIKSKSRDKDADGTEFGRHYQEANKRMKQLINLLLRLDMNVIITSHAKNEYGDNMKVLGSTFDCYKKLDYIFDLVFEVVKKTPDIRVGVIKKTRVKSFPEGETFPFNYAEIAKRYGREILERDAKPVELATKEQVAEVKRLIDLLKITDDITQKWLDKEESETFEEMTTTAIQKYIKAMQAKIQGEAA